MRGSRLKLAVAAVPAAAVALTFATPAAAYADDGIGILSGNNVGANVCGTDVNVIAEESGKTHCVSKINDNETNSGSETRNGDDSFLGLGDGGSDARDGEDGVLNLFGDDSDSSEAEDGEDGVLNLFGDDNNSSGVEDDSLLGS